MNHTSAPRRILHVVHSLQCGGAEVLVRDLVAARRSSAHFQVLSLSGDGPLAAQIESLGITVHRYDRKPGFDRDCSRTIARIVREQNIDIIHAHQYSPWVYAALSRLAGAWRAKVIYTEHGRPYPDYRKLRRIIVNRLALLPLTHRITSVSQFISRALHRYEAIPQACVELIYNGIDPGPLKAIDLDRRRSTRASLCISDTQVMVLQVAGFRPVKDHATALRAMAHLATDHPEACLVLAGDGQTLDTMRNLADQLHLGDRVIFLGRRDDVVDLWHAADIALLSSLSEGTSVALMEAMAAARPVVATDVGGNPELVTPGVTGLLTPRGDDRAMAGALATLVGDPVLRQQMGKAAQKRIDDLFTQTQMHDRFCAIYDELAPRAVQPNTQHSSLIIFADDFGRHPSSMQHLAAHLAADRQIVWVDTIGMRPFKLCRADIRRACEKIARWLSSSGTARDAAADAPNIRVIHPWMAPSFGGKVQRWLNKILLRRAVARAAASLPGKVQAITTLPITADLADTPGIADWTYYMVDDYANWPGHDGHVLGAMDQQQLQWVDRIIAVSDVLAASVPPHRTRPTIITHGIDPDHWQTQPRSAIAEQITRIPGTKAIFWGLIDARLNRDALAQLATVESCNVILVGPTQGDVNDLVVQPNIHLTGRASHDELPAIARAADVLIMPYADLPVTRAMQPLKLKEYLATDKPVVALALPSLRPWADCCDVVQPAEFAARVMQRAANGLPAAQRHARRRLADETWQAKARQFADVLEDRPGTLKRQAA